MSHIEHLRCQDHTSVMRGVCFCPTQNVVLFNPRLWARGAVETTFASELDLLAGDCIELLIERFFPAFDDVFCESVANYVCLPGMMMECEQHTGLDGYHSFQGM
jgi:hypothetical protein